MSVYIFDTEATDRKNGEIIEAAWLAIQPAQDLLGTTPDTIPWPMYFKPWSQRYKPATPSTYGAMAVHHILPHELEDCPPSSSFALPADTAYLIGHSIDFDWEAAGSPSNVKRICTHAMAQHVWPEATGYSQSALIYMLLGPTDRTREFLKDAHSALADVMLNAKLLAKILDAKPDIRTWSALWAFSEECRIPRTCPMKKYEGVPLEHLDDGFVRWCLNQDWLDKYFRIGLERVMKARYPAPAFAGDSDDDDQGSPW